jgi:hypothetical protein
LCSAYRKLVEESKYEIASVAAKVGKSESYVRQRIFLTRLEAPVAAAYRSGKINDGHAVLIAKLSATDLIFSNEKYDISFINPVDPRGVVVPTSTAPAQEPRVFGDLKPMYDVFQATQF